MPLLCLLLFVPNRSLLPVLDSLELESISCDPDSEDGNLKTNLSILGSAREKLNWFGYLSSSDETLPNFTFDDVLASANPASVLVAAVSISVSKFSDFPILILLIVYRGGIGTSISLKKSL